MVKTISYIDGIKALHTNCRLASCFVSYAYEQLSDYHAWWMLFVLLVLCAVNSLLTGGFPYKRSIVRTFVVWFMLFTLLVERWCLIKGFRIAGPMCGLSIWSQWILLTKEAKLWCHLSCLSKWTVEQTAGIQVSRKFMKLIECYRYVICHSVIDDITGHVCSETTGHQ